MSKRKAGPKGSAAIEPTSGAYDSCASLSTESLPSDRTDRILLSGTAVAQEVDESGLELRVMKAPDGRIRAFYFSGDREVREVCAGLNFSEDSWRLWKRSLVRAERLPLVTLSLCPLAEPKELSALDDGCAEVVIRRATRDCDFILSASILRAQIRGEIERARLGRLSAHEAAAILLRTHIGPAGIRPSLDQEVSAIVNAFVCGELTFLDAGTDRRVKPAEALDLARAVWGDEVVATEGLLWCCRHALCTSPSGWPEYVTTIELLADWYRTTTASAFELVVDRSSSGEIAVSRRQTKLAAVQARPPKKKQALLTDLEPKYPGTNVREFLNNSSRRGFEDLKAARAEKHGFWHPDAVEQCLQVRGHRPSSGGTRLTQLPWDK